MPAAAAFFGFGKFRNHSFRRNQQAGNRSRILQRRSDHFGRVNDTGFNHIGIFVGRRIITVVIIRTLQQLSGNNSPVNTGIFGNLTDRSLQSAANDIHADALILIGRLNLFQSLGRIQQSRAAAGNDAFLDRGARSVQRVVNTVFLFLDFNFGRTADFQHGNPAGQLAQTFLQLLAVIIGSRLFDFFFNLRLACFNRRFVAGTVNNRRIIFGNDNPLGRTQHINCRILKLHTQLFGNNLSAGQNCQILQNSLSSVAKAWSLNRADFQAASDTIDNQRRQSFAVNIFRYDKQCAAGLQNSFQYRQNGLQV